MKIPNRFLDDFTNPTDLMIACKFYSMAGEFTKRSSKGFEISVKISTLAKICRCSQATVRRSVKRLEADGFIISKHRRRKADGNFGAYIYTIKDYKCDSGFFSLNKKAFSLISGKAFVVYAWFCRLKDSASGSFYQSLSDLVRIIGYRRSEIIAIIKELIEKKLVMKQRKRTKSGDYTDNTYFVITYIRRKNMRQKKSRSPLSTATQAHLEFKNCIYFTIFGSKNKQVSVNGMYLFHERERRRLKHFLKLKHLECDFCKRGRVQFEHSLYNPLYILSF